MDVDVILSFLQSTRLDLSRWTDTNRYKTHTELEREATNDFSFASCSERALGSTEDGDRLDWVVCRFEFVNVRHVVALEEKAPSLDAPHHHHHHLSARIVVVIASGLCSRWAGGGTYQV
jgi:hypothetical protein